MSLLLQSKFVFFIWATVSKWLNFGRLEEQISTHLFQWSLVSHCIIEAEMRCVWCSTVAGSCVCLTEIAEKSSVPVASNTDNLILGIPLSFRYLKLFKGLVYAVAWLFIFAHKILYLNALKSVCIRLRRMTAIEREEKEKVKKKERKQEEEETMQQATWVKYTFPVKHQVRFSFVWRTKKIQKLLISYYSSFFILNLKF